MKQTNKFYEDYVIIFFLDRLLLLLCSIDISDTTKQFI